MIGQQLQLRKAEIERLSSPEQLDTAMRVTSPSGWVALLGLGAVIMAAVFWSIWGRMSEKVDGTGMIMRGENVQTIQAPTGGRVAHIKVGVGDLIREGQEVARLELSANEIAELKAEIKTTTARIQDLKAEKGKYDSRMRRVRASFQTQLDGLKAQLKSKEDLRQRGLAREQDVLAVKGQIAGIEAQIAQNETGESNLQLDINEEGRKLRQMSERLNGVSLVLATASGKVASILVAKDELIDAGARILNLENTDEEPYQVLLFVPFTEGKKVKSKMPVRISPTTVRPEEYGYILGEIISVSSLPVNPEEVRTTLNNDQLARKFAEDTPFRVRARPILDDKGRFQWTSAKGETLDIESNTPCNAQVITGERPPISYVIPKVKEILGIS